MPISIEQQISASPYLTRIAQLSQFDLNLNPQHLAQHLDQICTDLSSLELVSTHDGIELAIAQLLQAKTDFNYLWSQAEISRVLTQPELGRWQTKFAEITINLALKLAWLSVAPKHKVITQRVIDCQGAMPGLFILGMGKLGGYDLNFSSDVDLIAYFDPATLAVPDTLGKGYVCHQVIQKLTAILGQGGASNFVWRVDWRLRPNASATTLAMSTEVAEDYYFYRASPWHRLALMKARVVAGDNTLGQAFMRVLRPFIWRQNLDYRALDELAEIKQRINLEHPSLRAQRQWVDPISSELSGFNVKLGSGGIREIEFVANALQLLWGGRHASLRTSNTLDALTALFECSKLAADTVNKLSTAYVYLRRLENAIQMIGNHQTHLIPSSDVEQQKLMDLMGIEQWPQLIEQLNPLRTTVHDCFGKLFAEQILEQGDALIWPSGLSPQAESVVESWENGFINYGVSNQVRHRLRPLTNNIARYIQDNAGDASETIVRLHDFFRSLPSGEQYFRLLAESPMLLDSIVGPLLHSPAMTNLLKQSPHIIDCFLHQQWQFPEPFDSAFVTQTDDYGERLELMRRFVNEHLYQLYLRFLNGSIDELVLQKALTELAEHSLDLALSVVANEMNLDEVPITVIGMGKVGLRRMSPLSDLDLIFVFDQENTSMELASRFVNRLQTAIATPMREGILYELDTRLRPSGRSGAPTVSVDSFANHHLQRSHTWEHIALVASRIVAGNRKTEARLTRIKIDLITRSRDSQQFNFDAQKMWHRIAEHRVKQVAPELMFSKLCEGGLMQAEYLASCLILKSGVQLNIDNNEANFDTLLNACEPSGRLSEIIQFWRIQQLWERLLGHTEQALSDLPGVFAQRCCAQSGVQDIEELITKKQDYSEQVQKMMDAFFAEHPIPPSQLEDWQETKVIWS